MTDHAKSTAERWFVPLLLWGLPIVTMSLGFRSWLPPLASAHGAGIDRMLRYLLLSVGTLYVIGNAILGYAVWRFSRQGSASGPADTKTERRVSIIPVVIMTLVAEGGVFALGLPVWGKYYGPPPADVTTIEITGEQFAWNVHYPGADGKFGRTSPQLITWENPLGLDRKDANAKDDLVLLNDIHMPLDKPVRVRLRSKDVIHSFYLPNFRVRQDTVPGMTIEIWFTPTETGTFELACSQLCGFGHYSMKGLVTVETPEEFGKWLADQAGN